MIPPSNHRHQPNTFPSNASALAAIVRQHHAQGCSIIPLIGGDDAGIGKRPALPAWKAYQTQGPTDIEIDGWIESGLTAYGVVCGHISGIIVLDIDDSDVAAALARRLPRLMNTYTVRSGMRGTPHLYYRVDFRVRSQDILGGDLKAEGSYVVGAGSEIAGRVWQVENDAPIRTLTQAELERILTVLRPAPQSVSTIQAEGNPSDESIKTKPLPYHTNEGRGKSFSTSTIIPDSLLIFTYRDVAALYRAKVNDSRHRNHSLFNTARLLRDLQYSVDWTLDALAKIHANELPRMGQKQESFTRRLREAIGTINSAYSRSPRPIRPIFVENNSQPVSRLSGTIREKLLARVERDGTAILRTLEGLYLVGQGAGNDISLPEACQMLKERVGRSSILKAFSAMIDDENPLFDAVSDTSVRNCPPNIKAVFLCLSSPLGDADSETSYSASAGGSGGNGRPAALYRLPSPEELCQKLKVEPSAGDPITLDDIVSAKTYREALEREFIKRRPRCYAQSMLANRLNVSKRTIRRYHRDSEIQSRACYLDQHILWFNLGNVPLRVEAQEMGHGGCFLMDQMGKRYPAYREIARKLLARGKKVLYRQQTFNLYWYGDREPVAAEAQLLADGYERVEAQELDASVEVLCEDEEIYVKLERPTLSMLVAISDNHLSALRVETPTGDRRTEAISEVVYVKGYSRSQAPISQKRPRRRTKRKFRYPLEDAYAEKIANQVHDAMPKMSLCNARRLVDTYGAAVVNQTLERVKWLDKRGRATNPAGLLITMTGMTWRHEHGWGVPKPVFKAEPKRKARRRKHDVRKDPISKSEAWLRWSIQFWHELGDMEAVKWRQARLIELGFEPEVVGAYDGGEEIGEIDF